MGERVADGLGVHAIRAREIPQKRKALAITLAK